MERQQRVLGRQGTCLTLRHRGMLTAYPFVVCTYEDRLAISVEDRDRHYHRADFAARQCVVALVGEDLASTQDTLRHRRASYRRFCVPHEYMVEWVIEEGVGGRG